MAELFEPPQLAGMRAALLIVKRQDAFRGDWDDEMADLYRALEKARDAEVDEVERMAFDRAAVWARATYDSVDWICETGYHVPSSKLRKEVIQALEGVETALNVAQGAVSRSIARYRLECWFRLPLEVRVEHIGELFALLKATREYPESERSVEGINAKVRRTHLQGVLAARYANDPEAFAEAGVTEAMFQEAGGGLVR